MQSYYKTRLSSLTFMCIKSKLLLKKLDNRVGNWYESENRIISFASSCSIEPKLRLPTVRQVIITIIKCLLNLIFSKNFYAVVTNQLVHRKR